MDLTLPVREQIVSLLRAAAAEPGAPVEAARVYGMSSPPDATYPFVRYGVPDTLPFRATCIDGSSIAVTIHGFAEGPSEDEAAQIGAWIVTVVDDAALDLGNDNQAVIRWTGGTLLSDPTEKNIWHVYRTFDVDAVA